MSIFDVPGVLGRNLDHNRVKVSCCVKETHSPSLPNSASGPPRRICSRTISLRCLRPTRCSHTSYMYNSRIVSTWSNLMSSNKMAFTSCRSRAPREGRTPCGQGPHASFTNNMHVTTLHEPAGLSPAGHKCGCHRLSRMRSDIVCPSLLISHLLAA